MRCDLYFCSWSSWMPVPSWRMGVLTAPDRTEELINWVNVFRLGQAKSKIYSSLSKKIIPSPTIKQHSLHTELGQYVLYYSFIQNFRFPGIKSMLDVNKLSAVLCWGSMMLTGGDCWPNFLINFPPFSLERGFERLHFLTISGERCLERHDAWPGVKAFTLYHAHYA